VKFKLGGTFTSTLSVQPETGINVAAGGLKFQIRAPILKLGGIRDVNFNWSPDPLYNENFPTNGFELLGAGLPLRTVSTTLDPIFSDALSFTAGNAPPTTVTPVDAQPVGQWIKVDYFNPNRVGTALDDYIYFEASNIND
jgi:hypothetical protein